MHGPFVHNFQGIYDLLYSKGASKMVKDSDDLVKQIRELNQDAKAFELGLKGLKLVNSLDDKSKSIVQVINSFI